MYAPRILNEPVRCRFSHLSRRRRRPRRRGARDPAIGVRAATPLEQLAGGLDVGEPHGMGGPGHLRILAGLPVHAPDTPGSLDVMTVAATRLRMFAPLLVATVLALVAVFTVQHAACADPGRASARLGGGGYALVGGCVAPGDIVVPDPRPAPADDERPDPLLNDDERRPPKWPPLCVIGD